MNVILYLLGASLILGGGGLAIFLWSLRSGQDRTWRARPTASCSTTKRRIGDRRRSPVRGSRQGYGTR